MKTDDTAIRKRSQIAKANRTMFLWIAGASALVSFAIVASIFLTQKLVYNEKVIAEKNNTVQTLDKNNKLVGDLETAVRVLDTNSDLAKVKASDSDKAIQVILDALPSDANSLALGASLQNKLLVGIPGLTLESLQVDPVQGLETLGDEAVVDASVATDTANQITFTFSVGGNQEALLQVLTNLERSIRTIDISRLTIENQGTTQILTVQGRAFYEPIKNVVLYDKVVR
jgi:hypothetical protein